MKHIQIYDTTLRDGTQAEDINLTTEDKVRVALKLDELGVDYIEGGWPGSNPTDKKFFKEIKAYNFKKSVIAAFGSTHYPKTTADKDKNLAALVAAETPVITIFGKSWDIHVTEALRTSLEKNLDLIRDSLAFLRPSCKELFYDAEHFFDGFKANKDYALKTLERAVEGGADMLVLCDTNGGALPHEIRDIVTAVGETFPDTNIGVHTHNDAGLAVANAIAGVRRGAVQVQGTVNGYGERCGNANLCAIIPNLELKLDCACLPEGHLEKLAETARFVSEIANLTPFSRQPYVGDSAFAHKGGVHVSAVTRNPLTYEHIRPELVGNKQRVLLSDQSGQSNILVKARQYGFNLDKNDPFVLELLTRIKEREAQGYEYSAAEASYELMLNRVLGRARTYFTPIHYRVLVGNDFDKKENTAEAMVMIKVGGAVKHTAAMGNGPVDALDGALRKSLVEFYPNIEEMTLLDFKVRVLSATNPENAGTASITRVLTESGDANRRWVTTGVSNNVIEASWQAIEDSINYKLFIDDKEKLTKALQG